MNPSTKKRVKYASNLSLPSPEWIEKKRLSENITRTKKRRSSLVQVTSNIMNILNQNKNNIKRNSLEIKKQEQKIKSTHSLLALDKIKNFQPNDSSLSNYLVQISHKSPRPRRSYNMNEVITKKSTNEFLPIMIPIPSDKKSSQKMPNLAKRRVSIPLLNEELEKFQKVLEK